MLRAFDQLRIAIDRLGLKNSKPDYKSEAIEDLTGREWFKRMWTMQELVMAREPLVICGEKNIRWNNMHWVIVIVRDFADNRNSRSSSTVFNSVVTAESLWLDLYRKTEWSEAQVKRWSQGCREPFPALKRFVSFMQTYGCILTAGQILVILLVILIRSHRGLRPFDSMWLAMLIFCCAVTMIFTPNKTQADWQKELRSKIVGVLHMVRTRQATKEVDKVFALYGMLQELGIDLRKPDYKKPAD